MNFSYQTSMVKILMNHGILELCVKVFQEITSENIIKEFLFILSNVTADTEYFADMVLDNNAIM